MLNERSTPAARLLEGAGVSHERVYEAIQQTRSRQHVTVPRLRPVTAPWKNTPRDLTTMARKGKLDPVIGRDAEIRRIIQILTRRTKNNPMLIGDAGVGKTAIVEGLAQRIARGRPGILTGKSSSPWTWEPYCRHEASAASSKSASRASSMKRYNVQGRSHPLH